MVIEQIRLKKMNTFCYICGDEASRDCLLIDPAFEPERILRRVKRRNLQVTHVVNTHFHFDHTAGNTAILAATGALLLIHKLDVAPLSAIVNRTFTKMVGGQQSPKPDVLLGDEDLIRIGSLSLQVIHTPGHTRGSICLYGQGHLFTGDTLFVGSVGRTPFGWRTHARLIKSIHNRLFSLPGETTIWPGHDYGPSPSTTIRHEKETNPFLQI